MKFKKYLPETHPELCEEWDKTKNGNLRPEDVTYGSGKKIWWVCSNEDCKYSWKTGATYRTRKIKPTRCPVCSGCVATETNNLAVKFPEVAKEWDYTKNEGLRPEDVTYGSGKKVWWTCSKGHGRQASIKNRTRKVRPAGCPVCAWQVGIDSSLAVKFPELCKEWDDDKNEIDFKEVPPSSHKKVWWKCQAGHEWKAMISNRTRKINPTGCPSCPWKVDTNNTLAVKFPGLLEEWDDEKNEIGPKEISYGSNKKVWWVCKKESCRYEWQTGVFYRTKKINPTGCPVCSKRPISKISQRWLDTLNIEDREHFIKETNFRVDGFDPKTNTIYEFLGDYWHGNPEVFSAEKTNPTSKKSYGTLYQETMERIDILKENGYKVVYIWENDFNTRGKMNAC